MSEGVLFFHVLLDGGELFLESLHGSINWIY
jgi:hypothetical protein